MNAHSPKIGMPSEHTLARRWRKLAKEEGHTKRVPPSQRMSEPRTNGMPAKIMRHIADGEWHAFADIAEQVGVSASSLGHIMRRQLEKGIVERHKEKVTRNGYRTTRALYRLAEARQ